MTKISDTDETIDLSEDQIRTMAMRDDKPIVRTPRSRRRGPGLAVQFFLLAAALLIVTLGLTVAVAAWRADQVAEETIREDLARVPEVWAGYTSTRASANLEQVRSLAQEPGTMAIFAEEVDLATRLSFAIEDAPAMVSGGRTFFLFDRYSRVLARNDRPDGSGVGQPFAAVGWVASVLDSWQGTTAFIRERDSLAIVAAAPVITGEGEGARLEGVLAVTFPFDSSALNQLQSLTRGDVAVVLDMAKRDEAPALEVGGTTVSGDGQALVAAIFAAPEATDELFAKRHILGPVRADVAGDEQEVLAIPVENFDGEVLAAVLVARSRAGEMSSFYAIRRGLVFAGAIMLLLSLPVSFLLGRRIARPLRQLAAGAEAIRDGELEVDLPSGGGGEVGVLAGAFGGMVEELREKEALEQLLVDLQAQSADTGGTTIGTPPETSEMGDQRLPNPGEVFGDRYRIRTELGRGGMGVVYRASDLELEEDVALKVLKPEAFEDASDGLSKLKREIRIARRISHSNVIRVHDLVEAGGTRCLSMEYIPGTTLMQVLRQRGKLALAPGLQVAKQLCRGLAAVHNEGIVHRDLKPQNIMVLPNGIVKLMDFGISRGQRSGGEGKEKTVEGTPAYMSPEQCRGEELNQLSDIYSLGVVLWEMFAGRMPFSGSTVGAMIKHQLNTAAPPLRSVRPDAPTGLEQVIMSCLIKDRSQRPPSANAVYLNLREVLVTEW
ncbi:MAG: protein kinase [Acidobacteria bacterium]|nr:protein kinase [Candidatus Sulfomarinibacter kjeldsenii]